MIENKRVSFSRRQCERLPYMQEGLLGKGASASVYKVRTNNQLYALKRIEAYQIRNSQHAKALELQISVMKSLDHPNIVRLYDVYEAEDRLQLLMEYISGGTIFRKLKDQARIPQYNAKKYMKDVLKAVQYLHSFPEPIIHRDIKPENLLIDENNNIKLCDFGSAGLIIGNRQRSSYVGTSDYMAPQMKDCKTHGPSVDLWCIGILIYELLVGKVPQDPLKFPDFMSRPAQDLIKKILVEDPDLRLNLQEIKHHVWFLEEDYSLKLARLSRQVKGEDANQMAQRIKQKMNEISRNFNERHNDHFNIPKQPVKVTSSNSINQMEIMNTQYLEKLKKLSKLRSIYKANNEKILKLRNQLDLNHLYEKQQAKILEQRIAIFENKVVKLKWKLNTIDNECINFVKHEFKNLLQNLEGIQDYAQNLPSNYRIQSLALDEIISEKIDMPISQYLWKLKLKMLEQRRDTLVELKMILKRHRDMNNQVYFLEDKGDSQIGQTSTDFFNRNSEII